MVKVHALALAAAKRDPEHAIRTMQDTFNIPYKTAKETYETLLIPSIESQLEANSPWTLSNKSAGLTEKLFTAGEALLEAIRVGDAAARDLQPHHALALGGKRVW